MIYRACLLIPALFSIAAAQTADAGTVSGAILNSRTGAPVRRAAVALQSADPSSRRATVLTDTNGQFAFVRVPPGQYRVEASKDGYIGFAPATKDAPRAPTTLTLAEGQRLTGLVYRLAPAASIS